MTDRVWFHGGIEASCSLGGMQVDINSPEISRRHILKSTAAWWGASTFDVSAPNLFGQGSGPKSNATGSLRKQMMGFMLAHEQFRIPDLIDIGVAAENAGSDLLATSDHLQPWQTTEGHAGEAWVTMAALAQRTKR